MSRYWRVRTGCLAKANGFPPIIGKLQFCAKPTPASAPPQRPPLPPFVPPPPPPPPRGIDSVCWGRVQMDTQFWHTTGDVHFRIMLTDLQEAKNKCAEDYLLAMNGLHPKWWKHCNGIHNMDVRDPTSYWEGSKVQANGNRWVSYNRTHSWVGEPWKQSYLIVPCEAPSPPPLPPGDYPASPPPPTCAYELVFRQTTRKRPSDCLFTSNDAEWLHEPGVLEIASINPDDPHSCQFSLLNELHRFRGANGKFHFKQVWPGMDLRTGAATTNETTTSGGRA